MADPLAKVGSGEDSVQSAVDGDKLRADPFSSPDASRRIVYGRDIVSDPMPEPGVAVAIDAASALAAFESSGPKESTPVATLRMVTSRANDVPAGPGPVWVVTWFDTELAHWHGRARRPGSEESGAQRPRDLRCVTFAFVDAESGRTSDFRQVCVGGRARGEACR